MERKQRHGRVRARKRRRCTGGPGTTPCLLVASAAKNRKRRHKQSPLADNTKLTLEGTRVPKNKREGHERSFWTVRVLRATLALFPFLPFFPCFPFILYPPSSSSIPFPSFPAGVGFTLSAALHPFFLDSTFDPSFDPDDPRTRRPRP